MPQIILAILILLSLPTLANTNNPQTQINTQVNNLSDIIKILNKTNKIRFKTLTDKIAYISELFLNKPYAFNTLGEGENARFDEYQIYRTDVFDCETFVDTVLALALAQDVSSFEQYIKLIRYKDGKVSFINRNHFTSLDWNKNNQKQNLLKDITQTIVNTEHKSIALMAQCYIDKPNWYKHLSISRIRIKNLSDTEKQKRLATLRKKGQKLTKSIAKIPYIPFNALFDAENQVNMSIFKQIPNGAILEIVRPNWNLYDKIGTNLNVSHLGFVVWQNNKPFFIHASSEKNKVTKVSLIQYLQNAKKSPTIKGINVQVIVS